MKVLGRVITVLTVPCYVAVVLALVVAAPLAAGYRPVVVLSGSMEPTYRVGSVLYYKAAGFDDIAVGDVVTYKSSDDAANVVTHRVYAIDAGARTFTLKGDANPSPDPNAVPYASVLGRLESYRLPYVGFAVRYLQNPYIIGALIGVFALKWLIDRWSAGGSDTANEV